MEHPEFIYNRNIGFCRKFLKVNQEITDYRFQIILESQRLKRLFFTKNFWTIIKNVVFLDSIYSQVWLEINDNQTTVTARTSWRQQDSFLSSAHRHSHIETGSGHSMMTRYCHTTLHISYFYLHVCRFFLLLLTLAVQPFAAEQIDLTKVKESTVYNYKVQFEPQIFLKSLDKLANDDKSFDIKDFIQTLNTVEGLGPQDKNSPTAVNDQNVLLTTQQPREKSRSTEQPPTSSTVTPSITSTPSRSTEQPITESSSTITSSIASTTSRSIEQPLTESTSTVTSSITSTTSRSTEQLPTESSSAVTSSIISTTSRSTEHPPTSSSVTSSISSTTSRSTEAPLFSGSEAQEEVTVTPVSASTEPVEREQSTSSPVFSPLAFNLFSKNFLNNFLNQKKFNQNFPQKGFTSNRFPQKFPQYPFQQKDYPQYPYEPNDFPQYPFQPKEYPQYTFQQNEYPQYTYQENDITPERFPQEKPQYTFSNGKSSSSCGCTKIYIPQTLYHPRFGYKIRPVAVVGLRFNPNPSKRWRP